MKKITELQEWQNLKSHCLSIAKAKMNDWFREEPHRFKNFSLSVGDIFLDYSKNRISNDSLTLLKNLAMARLLPEKIEQFFTGHPLNTTEARPVLHTALRNIASPSLIIDGQNIMPAIHETLSQMRIFTDKIRNKTWAGATGKPIKDIINVGIGGSHLGPLMTTHALSSYAQHDLHCHFISNIDSDHLYHVLKKINAETTLFIISSKSFTTLETITNANTLVKWFKSQLNTDDISKHFIAVTAAPLLAMEFGVKKENIFLLWDWVGGRFSIWSAIGLPLAIMIGMDHFMDFLAGAYEMDQHFRYTEFTQNMPVILGLLGIWYVNFFAATHHAIVPYAESLNYLRMYLQQLDMESNGKYISHMGENIDVLTCPVVFGEQGCNGQHAFHQLLHQGPHFIPVDFILVCSTNNVLDHHQDILFASALSQAQALMCGKSYDDAYHELKTKSIAPDTWDLLAKHKATPGNRPSNTIILKNMTPKNLGALIALYEHKTFVQGVIWQVNSFDQWGVELGKKLLPNILSAFQASKNAVDSFHDASTLGLIEYYKNTRGLT